MAEFDEKFNYDDVILRRIISSLLMEMKDMMYFYQQASEDTIRKVNIPCLFSVTGQEQFLRDKFIYDYEDIDIAKLDYEYVPRCVLQFTGLTIDTSKSTNKFIPSVFERECGGVMRECEILTAYVPISLSFKSTIIVSNVNEMFKGVEAVISKLYHRVHAFTVDAGLFNVDALIRPLESYTQSYPIDFQVSAKKEFKIEFDLSVNTYMPCYENGALTTEIDEALKNIKNPENENGTVTFYRDAKGILRARLSSLLSINMNIDTSMYSETKEETVETVKTPVTIVYAEESIYRGFTYTSESGEHYMINGKARTGSSEKDSVWTVYFHKVSIDGNVLNTTIKENVSWDEIIHKYSK